VSLTWCTLALIASSALFRLNPLYGTGTILVGLDAVVDISHEQSPRDMYR